MTWGPPHPGPGPGPSLAATLSELTKFPISFVSTLTAVTGFLAFRRVLNGCLALTFLGTLLMAMAASALNEVQERDLDARMERTRLRPIPRGAVSPEGGTLFALALGSLGFTLLYSASGYRPALLGLLALGWYNGLYTPMKRFSAFAVVPGSLIGALPPAIGWSAAGGNLAAPRILALCFLFFLWQVPHFWLLALLHREGYEHAGFPTLARYFDETQILRLIFTWTCATVAACGLLAAFHTVTRQFSMGLLAMASLWLLVRFALLLRPTQGPAQFRRAFMDINLYALTIMLAVALGS